MRNLRKGCRRLLLRDVSHAVLLALFFAPLILAAQQDSQSTLRVNVRLVDVFVNVTDKNGAIVGGLNKDDFALFEDGRPQKIAVFERQSAVPLALTLAIDTSGSVKKDMNVEEDAARHFVREILRPQDQMSVMQFATTVSTLAPFTNKASVVDRALGRLHADWATALYDAVCEGSASLGRKQGRKVLVVISDGDDTVQSSTYDQALEAALRNEVTIFSLIDVPIAASAGRDTGGEHALITLSEQTGGKHYYVNAHGLDAAFKQVSADLRTEYLLGYYPRNQEPGRNFHRISVTIPRASPGAFEIRHRTGYYSDPTVSSTARR
ncbi:MAG: VWA domain-containing protein [Acidobacteriota bacterium]